MADRPARPSYHRARSEAEKEDRRREILAAAEAQISDGGWEHFTIGSLAAKAGVAKGTLYLYFETKEEVIKALFDAHFSAWVDALLERIEPGMSDSAFCQAFLHCTRRDSFLPTSVSATTVSSKASPIGPSALIETIGKTKEVASTLSERAERCLDLRPGQGWLVINGLWALMLGADALGPQPSPSSVDRDLQAEMDRIGILSCDALFLRHGPAIIAGIRASG